MNYEFEVVGDILKVCLDGCLVAACSEDFKKQTLERVGDTKNILLDLSRMSHIDSSGLGAMVFLLQKVTASGGAMKLACLQARPRIIFDITKVYRVFEIYDTVEAALKSFETARG